MRFKVNMIHAVHNARVWTGWGEYDTDSTTARVAGRSGDIFFYPEAVRRYTHHTRDLVYAAEIIGALPSD